MDHEAEMIRRQMEETRSSLSEKLETLENQVVETVQGATSAVTDTVANVKEAVQETVDTVKGSVEETVSSVKNTFDLPRQMDRHPWAMMGGAVALGYLGGRLLQPSLGERTFDHARPSTLWSTLAPGPAVEHNGGVHPKEAMPATQGRTSVPSTPTESTKENWLGALGDSFASEIAKVKGLAIGTMLGIVRDMVAAHAPRQMESDLKEVFDNITTKLGGKPIRGPLLQENPSEEPPAREAACDRSRSTAMDRPLGAGRQSQAPARGTAYR